MDPAMALLLVSTSAYPAGKVEGLESWREVVGLLDQRALFLRACGTEGRL